MSDLQLPFTKPLDETDKATPEAVESLLALHGLRRELSNHKHTYNIYRLSDGARCKLNLTFGDPELVARAVKPLSWYIGVFNSTIPVSTGYFRDMEWHHDHPSK